MDKRSLFALFLLLSLLGNGIVGRGQSPSLGDELREKYPSASTVFLKKKESLEISKDGDEGLEVLSETYNKIFYLTQNASAYSQDHLDHSGFFHLEDIEASSYVPEEGKDAYEEIEVEEFKKKDVVREGSFHNDIRRVSFYYPQLAKDGMTELRYEFVLDEARFIQPFYFRTGRPVQHSVFEVTVDEGINISFKFFNIDSSRLEYTREENLFGTKVTHRWEMKEQKGLPVSEKVRDGAYYAPHIIPVVRTYKNGDTLKPLLSDVDDLYAWYWDLVNGPASKDAPKVRSLVDSLLKGVKGERSKVRKIYYWVKDNIQYIAIENGLGGFVPRPPGKVYKRGYGDCKDMSDLMRKMMEYAGIDAHLTWVGTRSIPYDYKDLPSPSVDNHMILTYIDPKGKHRFLDATNSHLHYPLPTPFIQGKKALVGKGEGDHEIVKVPEPSASRSHYDESIQLGLENGVLTGSSKVSLSGYLAMEARRFFTRSSDKSQQAKVEQYLQKGNNKFSVTDQELSGIEDRDKELVIRNDFRMPDFIAKSGDEIYLSLILNKVHLKEMKEEGAKGRQIRYHNLQTQEIILHVPKGYEVDHIPKDRQYKNEHFEFSIDYERKGGDTVKATFRYGQHFLYLSPEHKKEWNAHVRTYKEAKNDYLILKKSEEK